MSRTDEQNKSAEGAAGVPSFARHLAGQGLSLLRGETGVLQINLGLTCNQVCKHCHLDAGPNRAEMMSAATAEEVIAFQERARLATVDITGGAPEMNPNLPRLVQAMRPLCADLMARANLTALGQPENRGLIDLFAANRVTVVASFPSLNPKQAEAQRGGGIFDVSIATLQALCEKGYGRPGSGLVLNLVSNPAGAFLPPAQAATEQRFRRPLQDRHGITFNNLFTFANVPLGRFRRWLAASGNLEGYLGKLHAAFNPCALDGVMCRTLVSVNWDGHLYDCDFNLAAGLPLGGAKTHVDSLAGPPREGTPIAVGDHCYACTAGAGFT